MSRIYLDYAASTPVDPLVEKAMRPYFGKIFGNAGALHQFGQEAAAAVFEARNGVASAVGASYRDIIFTGSATEANNLALRGVVKAANIKKPRIIVSNIEHESILETCNDLEQGGVEVVYLSVTKEGIVDVAELKNLLNNRTILVSVMYANNEIGAIQPIAQISKIIRDFRDSNQLEPKAKIAYPLFHADAVQGIQYLDCDVKKLGVDLMTLSGHKIYGPKGIGCLYAPFVGNCYPLSPIITGGGQQNGIHSGTENVPYIVAFAKAVELTEKIREKEFKRVVALREHLWKGIKKIMPSVLLNGSSKHRLPNNLNIYFPKDSAQDLLIKLDLAGVAVSSGSACKAHLATTSYVLKALGLPDRRCSGSLRLSLGRQTTRQEINRVLDIFKELQ
ncbi:MAG: cysteine desulfurase family protein [bacterium]|nr:cysteine desulfurase family protein [bacterium]